MDYNSRQHGPEASGLPSILIASDPPPRFRHAPHSTPSLSSSTSAMSIPGVQEIEEVPPALPPPPFPFGKPPNSDYREPRRDNSFSSFSSREPSLFGSFSNSMRDRRDGPIVRVDRDEGYASLSSTRYGTGPPKFLCGSRICRYHQTSPSQTLTFAPIVGRRNHCRREALELFTAGTSSKQVPTTTAIT